MVQHKNIKISGQVQGVVFRYSAKEQAEKLNIQGFAKNEPDNTVFIEAEGEEKDPSFNLTINYFSVKLFHNILQAIVL